MNVEVGIDLRDREFASYGVGMQPSGAFRISDQRGDRKSSSVALQANSYFANRSVDEDGQRIQAPFQNITGSARNAHVAEPQGTESQSSGRHRVAQFMDKESDTFSCLVIVMFEDPGIALSAEFQYGVSDRVVEAPVQGAELVDGKRRIKLKRQVRDGLAEVAIVVNDLVDRVPQRQKAGAVRDCSKSDFPSPPDAPEIPTLAASWPALSALSVLINCSRNVGTPFAS